MNPDVTEIIQTEIDLVTEEIKENVIILFDLKDALDSLNKAAVCKHDWITIANYPTFTTIKCAKCGYETDI